MATKKVQPKKKTGSAAGAKKKAATKSTKDSLAKGVIYPK